jgi:Cu(I)/Ag(I) efflux system membrane fusion protein
MKHIHPALKSLIFVAALAAVFFLGTQWGTDSSPDYVVSDSLVDDHGTHAETAVSETSWTCTMHLQIKRSEPGICPLCKMELIPLVNTVSDSEETWQLTMSEQDRNLAKIATAPIERKFVEANVRMVGKIDYDETKVKTISAWVPGRIERLYVDYTGISVKKGDHMVSLFSPELLTAQEELIEAASRVQKSANETSEFLRNSDRRALESAREKLRLWGLTNEQIESIEKSNKPTDNIQIESPQGGVVIEKGVNEGQYVQTGTPIYKIADLSRLWVRLDAYESDLPWLHFGQKVQLETDAYPGEIFEGQIAFIDPILDDATRTINIRVNVENAGNRLKPGMFTRALVHAQVAKEGRVMDPLLAGKWISPMHPEIIRDTPGDCPICGMELVKASDLGYTAFNDDEAKPLVVPATAVLQTGKRAVVYVEVPNRSKPTYEGREIVLGARAGDYFLIKSGLHEGEQVVVNGAFNIDSSLQIKAKPSMLSMGPDHRADDPSLIPFLESLNPVYDGYFDIQQALAADQLDSTVQAVKQLSTQLDSVNMVQMKPAAHSVWMLKSDSLKESLTAIASMSSLDDVRVAFESVAKTILDTEKEFGHWGDTHYVEVYCPMAFERGASWLQMGSEIFNPYYGAEMLNCGEIKTHHMGIESTSLLKTPSGQAGHQH